MSGGSSQWMYQAEGYQIENSLRFNDGDVAELLWPASAHSGGNRRTFTHSFWTKRGVVTSTHQVLFEARDGDGGSSDNIKWENGQLAVIYQDGTLGRLKSTALFRDSSAWYHIVVAVDTTQGTNTNRIKVYVNGVQLTSFTGTNTYMDQNSDTRTSYASSDQQYGNARHPDNDHALDGYLADINFVDGLQLTPTSFGEYNKYGQWVPINPKVVYGAEGYRLQFLLPTANAANIGKDTSGNGNNFTPDNLVASDQMLDTPTNNFATMNFLTNSGTSLTLSNANLGISGFGSARQVHSTIMPESGKWYAEFLMGADMDDLQVGIANSEATGYLGQTNNSMGMISINGKRIKGGSQSAYGSEFVNGGIISVALDLDNSKVFLAEDNTFQDSGNPVNGDNPMFSSINPYIKQMGFAIGSNDSGGDVVANFGQDGSFAGNKTSGGHSDDNGRGDFFYAPPAGYLALCTKNLPEPENNIIPSENFNTVLYTGDASDDRDIQVGFRPGWTWIKQRNGTANHTVWDIMRGGTKYLNINTANADATDADGVDTGKTNAQIGGGGGFRLLGSSAQTNGNNNTFASWHWKASDAGGVSNSNGSITSSNNVNTDAGFSIVTWSGTAEIGTVGHGLSKIPRLIAVKNRSAGSTDWQIFTTRMTSFNEMNFNTNHASTATNVFNDTEPTSSVFSIDASAVVNGDGNAMIAYCFHDVLGFSKFDSYEGNNNANGRFVHTGFRPALLWIKKIDDSNGWQIFDNKRSPHNVVNARLQHEVTNAEATNIDAIDFTSNGFKLRTTDTNFNAATTYDYMVWAETPFKFSSAR
tara:strand:+ start:14 stop:2449 length:2436 start_codon:yes stop_codon:yes gene_type:complete